MRWNLKAGVGIGQPNNHDDVKKVQTLLNRAMRDDHLTPLVEDGRFGPKTQTRIGEFQAKHLHMANADQVVNRSGPTQRALGNSVPAAARTAAPAQRAQQVPHPQTVVPGSSAAAALQKQAATKPENNKTRWFNRALPAAINVKSSWGVPIAVTLAQGALESSWGTHAPGNVFFGVKGKSPDGSSINLTTHEVEGGQRKQIQDGFRSYNTLEQSADDYGRFLATQRRYRPAFAHKNDPLKFIHEVAKAGYATDPDYEKKLSAIIRVNGLADYDSPEAPTSASFQNPLHQ